MMPSDRSKTTTGRGRQRGYMTTGKRRARDGRLTVAAEHGLHDVARPQRRAVLPPVVGRDLEDEQGDGQPEQDVEAVKGAVGRRHVLGVKGRELPREDQAAEPAAGPGRSRIRALAEEVLHVHFVGGKDVDAGLVLDDGGADLEPRRRRLMGGEAGSGSVVA